MLKLNRKNTAKQMIIGQRQSALTRKSAFYLKLIFGFVIVFLLFIHEYVNAQVQVYPVSVTTQLTPPYSVNLVDYAAPGCEQLKVIIVQRDLTQAPYMLYLKMIIELNGRVIIRTSPHYMPPPLTLDPGIPTIISGTDLYPFLDPQNMDFVGYSRDSYLRTKSLPEGAYVITFTAYDYARREVALSRGGAMFCYLAKTDPPLLNFPLNNTGVPSSPSQYITFQWLSRSASSPNSAQSTGYRFELFEMRINGSYPSEIVQNSRPIFTAETDRTSLAYTIGDPLLENGLRYAWRIRAFDTEGRDYIRNNGYSEVFSFVYGVTENTVLPFDIVENFVAQAISTRKAKLSWDASTEFNSYKVFYRKQGNENKWYDEETVQNTLELNGLSPGKIYECRVQGKKNSIWGGLSVTDTVLQPMPTEIICGSPYLPLMVSNREPMNKLLPLQEIDAGGFIVTIVDAKIDNGAVGRFSGRGFVQVPLFENKKIRCEFTNIFVNTDYQMAEGVIRLMTDKSEGADNAMWDIDKVFEGGSENGTVINGTEGVTIILPDVLIPGSGAITLDTAKREIVIVTATGDTIQVNVTEELKENPKTITVKDSGGNLYSVDTKTGKATSIGKAPAGGSQQQTPLPAAISSDKGIVVFEAIPRKTIYAFDKRNTLYARSSMFTEKYKTMPMSDGTLYDIPFKLIPTGETDVILAVTKIKDKSLYPGSIVFQSGTGTRYTAQPVDSNGKYLLTLPSGKDNDGIDVYAVYPNPKGQPDVLGKLIVMSYSVKRPRVVLVPVNGNYLDAGKVKEELDKVYNPVAVDWQVSTDTSNFSASADSLDVTSSGLFSQYTPGMKKLNNAFIKHKGAKFDPSTLYLFVLQWSDKVGATGDMPRSKQFGYLFTKTALDGGEKALYRTIAHEIAHGAFHLNHTFDSNYQIAESTTNNLMDYTSGTDLVKHQWDAIHNPGLVIGMFERDEEGMSIATTDDFQKLLQILAYSGVNTFVFGIKCESAINDGFSLYSNGYRYYFLKYSTKENEEKIEVTLLNNSQFPSKELYSKIQVPKLVIPSAVDKLLILNKEVNGTVTPFLCNVQEDYPDACKVQKLTDVAGFYDKILKDISNCIVQKDVITQGGLTLAAMSTLLQSLQSQSRSNQQFEFSQNGQVYRLNSQNQAQLIQNPKSNAEINASTWDESGIDMRMRIGFNASGILQFDALGINKNLTLATGKKATLNGENSISQNMLLKGNALLNLYKVKTPSLTPAMAGTTFDSDEFPDGKKVNIDENASFFKILCEAGGISVSFLKTAEIEQPVYLSASTSTIQAPPIATGTLESVGMMVTDITSVVSTIYDIVTDAQARKEAKDGFIAIKDQVKDEPTKLFPILGEVVLQEFTGSTSGQYAEMTADNTDEGRRGHLVTKTSVRTATSIFVSGKFLTKLPDMAKSVAAKMTKAKSMLKFRSIKGIASDVFKSFENKLKTLQYGGQKFLDDFKNALDGDLKKIIEKPELVDAWKKMDDLGADEALRKNLGALEALSKPKGSRLAPRTYLDADYIANHLSKFDDGAIRFTSRKFLGDYGTLGPDGGFVMPKSEFDKLLKETNGDLRKIEKKLGLKEGYLDNDDTMIALIEKKDLKDIRMPTGNEGGADPELWIPGGKTSGGVSEAVMDFSGKPPYTEIIIKRTTN